MTDGHGWGKIDYRKLSGVKRRFGERWGDGVMIVVVEVDVFPGTLEGRSTT